MPARYHLVTHVETTAALEQVWRVLVDFRSWPAWWRWARRVEELRVPGPTGVGGVYLNEMSTPLAYTVTYRTEVLELELPERIRVSSTGDLEGEGLMVLGETARGAEFTFTWLVETRRPWMRFLSPVARPAFVWNHHRLMDDFASGLAAAAGATLIECTNTVVRPGEAGFFALPV